MKKNSILKIKGPADRSLGSRQVRRAKRRLASKQAARAKAILAPGANASAFKEPGRGKHW